ncbi:MAG: valine--tRNA ligase [Acetobacteraceae bacterium]|nr:valine--tRNA ligase [Acetobacteraceae bacterium]
MLNKSHTPAETEARLYADWEGSGAFAAAPEGNAVPYTIMIPPPNVTGSLHMGHALTFTVQDTLTRWRRMQGRDALWQPGTDHAGIATQMVVERLLADEGITRQALGREKFLERVWQWKAESGSTITRQLRRLGASLDWPRERFTMDDGLSEAVREVFVTLFNQGLIYRDRRLVNWDPQFQSAISDLEVENREMRGSLWYITYPIDGMADRFITVATTRPETMLGDTAVAVNPHDDRFADLVGRFAILPLIGRRIPIIADEYSDPTKGTGAVKITPAHDFNDFAVGQRHQLAMPSILDKSAKITLAEIEVDLVAIDGLAHPAFVRGLAGLNRFAARKAIVAELENLGRLDKIEPHTSQVPHGDRSGVPIEPLLTIQWYCNAEVLAKPAIEAVEQGRTKFVPQQWENTFFAWMRDIQPWCISRQLWWGHRIPAFYGPDGHVIVAKTAVEAQILGDAYYGKSCVLTQDEDVLDTWFSSALWPFSTLGWPTQTRELARYYPGDTLVTGFDIIFFWVARMMMMGIHFMGDVPFKTVYIHGLVRDERGQKMSKSKGNVIDPLALIDDFGADALRFAICSLTGPGRDVALGKSRIESYRSFVTKLWNAARFCEMNGVKPNPDFRPENATLPLSRWILAEASDAIAAADTALEAYRFDDYAGAGYKFTWRTFCDWFLEFAKPALFNAETKELVTTPEAAELRDVAGHVLGLILRMLHPAIPYVTEEIWHKFGFGEEGSLIRTAWPKPFAVPSADAARAEVDWVVRLISEIRTVRSEMNIAPSIRTPILLKDATPADIVRAQAWIEPIGRMARATNVEALVGDIPNGAAQILLDNITILLPLAGLIDFAAERTRLERDRAKSADDADKIRKKLDNADFVSRAKPEVVEENRDRLAAAEVEISRLTAALARVAA